MFRGFLRSTNHSPPLRQEQAPSTTPLLCCHPAWRAPRVERSDGPEPILRSEEHTSELQSHLNLVCRLLLEKKKIKPANMPAQNLDPTSPAMSDLALRMRVPESFINFHVPLSSNITPHQYHTPQQYRRSRL